MRIVVLGSSGTYPGPASACSGFLVTQGDTRLLIDCGTGVFANLQTYLAGVHLTVKDLTGIVISHMHADHFLDLVPLRFALQYGEHHFETPIPLYFPPGGRDIWERVVQPFDETKGSFSAPFRLLDYGGGQELRFGSLNMATTLLRHYVPSYAMEITGKQRLVYSADCGPDPNLAKVARNADLFVCEATWLKHEAPANERGHLTAREAGEVARAAGVHRLLLTHVLPGDDALGILRTAREAFGGEVSLAEVGQTYHVGEPASGRVSRDWLQERD